MSQDSRFQFKSKLLKNKTRGIASMVEMAGGQDCHIEINELLALAGADSETPRAEIDEARAELRSIFASKKHPFWDILDEKENELTERLKKQSLEDAQAWWDAQSSPLRELKIAAMLLTPPAIIIFIFWNAFFRN